MGVLRVDAGAETYLAVCACGWRSLALSRDGAWRVAAGHERAEHPDSRTATDHAAKRTRAVARGATEGRPFAG